MGRIKIEQIQQEAMDNKWELVSTEYKNLNTELEFVCPEGHKVITTYAVWRARHSCPICEKPKLNLNAKIVPRKKDEIRILALDQATHTTGWCVFADNTILRYGALETQGNLDKRINDTKLWLANMVEMWQPSKVVLEDIQLQEKKQNRNWENDDGNSVMNVATFKTLAQLQGVLIDFLYENNIPYTLIHTATWREICHITGKYRSDKKRSAQLKIKEWFDLNVSNDIADAICIAKAAEVDVKKHQVMLDWS